VPELPEVETYAQVFRRHALGRTVARVRVLDDRVLAVRKSALAKSLTGRQFSEVRRHGKHLFARAGDVWLRLHFGMSGDLTPGVERFARVVFEFDDGTCVAFDDLRLFGVVDLCRDPDEFIRERGLGPDPLAIGVREFRKRLAGKRGAIKAVLLSQEVIAGVGNLYADETLYRAGIHPSRAADTLGAAEVKTIFTALRRVLADAISERYRGFMVEEREEGARCRRCGGTIRRTVVAGRTTYFCSLHQRRQ
jgi:formamidopyrimidine-DNA glycosylase